jgi:hypothetical protein
MDKVPESGSVVRAVSSLIGEGEDKAPDFRCPKCRTEVSTPPSATKLTVENLEDYRRECLLFVRSLRNRKLLLGGFWTDNEQAVLDEYERFVRILDAMTSPERLETEPPSPAEHERLAVASGTMTTDVERLFERYAISREIHQKAVGARMPWWAIVAPVLLVLPGIGMWHWAQSNALVATILCGLGFYLLAAALVLLCLTRVKNAARLVFSSRVRRAVFLIVLPGLLATTAIFLSYDHIVGTGIDGMLVTFGCCAVVVFLFPVYSRIMSKFLLRRFAAAPADPPSAPAPNP